MSTKQADALAALPEITAMTQIPGIRAPIEAVQRYAAAAGAAAGAAARAAAWDALAPTKKTLQQSARKLVIRMIECKDGAS